MSEWYLKSYINRRNWILENAQNINLNAEELLLCLFIDYFNENHIAINYELLSSKLGLNQDKVDKLIQDLSTKGILEIYVGESGVRYDINRIFELLDDIKEDISNDIFKMFEDSFARPLSPFEMAKLSDLISEYGESEILEALRNADAYRKLNFAYIEKILKNNHE